MNALDFVAASIFLVCETFAIVNDLRYRNRQMPKRLDAILWIAEILAVVSIIYLATLRIFPYAWFYMKGI